MLQKINSNKEKNLQHPRRHRGGLVFNRQTFQDRGARGRGVLNVFYGEDRPSIRRLTTFTSGVLACSRD